MAEINLAIRIPEEEYNIIKNSKCPMVWAEHLIAKGVPLPSGWNRYDDNDPKTWPKDGSWGLWQHKSGGMNVLRWKQDAQNHFFPDPYNWDIEDVVAWMPLPKRYKVESEGKE